MCWGAWSEFATLMRAEHVVLLRSLSSVPPIYDGHFQISSFVTIDRGAKQRIAGAGAPTETELQISSLFHMLHLS